MVLCKNMPEIFNMYNIPYNDIIELKIQGFVLDMRIYKSSTSTTRKYTCPDHG
jgi:hypothetical protein